MKQKLKLAVELAILNLVIYPFGVLLAAAFLCLRFFGYVRIMHWERFPHFKEKVIVAANHPSMVDPFLIVSLFFKGYLINPLKYGPLIVSDRKIFYDSWYWFWLRLFLIPVDRGNKRSEACAFLRIKKALNNGRAVIIFPEGGRTFWGEKFLYSQGGKKIRILKQGVALLVAKTKAQVVPIWLEGTEKFLPNSKRRLFTRFRFRKKTSMLIKIGEPLHFEDNMPLCREEIIQIIASSLLQLADEKIDP